MDDFSLHINPDEGLPKKKVSVKYLKNFLLLNKFEGWYGFLFFSVLASILALGIAKSGMGFAIMAIAAMLGIPIVYFLVVSPEFGIIFYLTMAYFLMWFGKLGVNFQLGTLMDAMLAFFILGFFIQMKRKPEWHLMKSRVSILVLVWILYNFIEVANPAAESRLAWLYTVRTVALITLMYFIFLLNIRTKRFLKIIIKWWVCVSVFSACYAFKQEYFGFFDFEQRYLDSDPNIALLLFIAGHWRKFSIFTDPVTFAYNMVMVSLLCMALISGPVKTYKKVILGFLAFFFLFVMLFSGTRGAYPLVPAALVLFAILKYNKQVLVFTGIAMLFLVFLIFVPTSNQNILRFQSAFHPSEDASYKVRQFNQARIKPFVYAHPIGGGLGATGTWGQKFAPNSFLASFPPDSGYVRITVELGWIGLIIFCIMIFSILQTGINNYFKIRDPELKSYLLAMVLIVFAWNIGNFPQEALVQYPSNVLFFLAVALISVIYRIDQQQNLIVDAKQ